MQNFHYFLCATIIAMSATLLSCGDDDDESGSANGNITAGQVTTSDGTTLYITAIGGYDNPYDCVYNYDEDGRLISFYDDYDDDDNTYYSSKSDPYEVTYDPFTIKLEKTEHSDYDYYLYTLSDINVNSKGYITSFNYYSYGEGHFYSYDDDGELVRGEICDEENGSASFSYDSDGHLVKTYVSIDKTHDVSDNYSYDTSECYTETITNTNTWQNGLLISSTCSDIDYYEDGDTYVSEVTNEYTYTSDSGDYPNTTYQFTPSNREINGYVASHSMTLEYLTLVGYFGKAPNYHPISMYQTGYNESDGVIDDDEPETYYFKYTLLSNGAVASCYLKQGKYEWDRYGFTYSQF